MIHPYHSPVIGWMSDLENLQRNDVIAFYKRYYTPNNAILVIAGAIDSQKIRPKIRNTFGNDKW